MNKSTVRALVLCSTCPHATYTLKNSLHIQRMEEAKGESCKLCPVGAICNGGIRVLDNYWGTRDLDDDLTVMPCPRGYCCSSDSNPCVSHNTCNVGRQGILCGRCKSGYMLNFFDKSCIPKGSYKCNLSLFVVYIMTVSCLYTFLFTLFPIIVEKMKQCYTRNKVPGNEEDAGELNSEYDDGIKQETMAISNNPIPMGAVVTQIVFFFQLASIVHIEPVQRSKIVTHQDNGNSMRTNIFDAFNFRFSVYREVCPTDNMTFVFKLAINLGLKLNTLVNIFWVFVVYKCFSLVTRSPKKRRTPEAPKTMNELLEGIPSSSEQTNVIVMTRDIADISIVPLTFVSQLKIGFLKLFKMNYTSTILILLQLVHCERIKDRLHLHLSGDHICYCWWQWIIITVYLPILALFPLSFGMALDKLRKRIISTNTFLVSCVVPFAFIIKRKFYQKESSCPFIDNEEDVRCSSMILQLEEELFDVESKGIRWNIIQLYRMLIIVLIDTFVLNPVFKSSWFCVIFVGFSYHDRERMPFKHPFLNQLQRLTSACLFLVTVCSNPSAFSSVGDIRAVPYMDIFLTFLRYFELFLYVVVVLALPWWKLWEKYCHHQEQKRGMSN